MSVKNIPLARSLCGFSLIELLVALSIIGLLSTIVYASFGTAREQTRDKARMAALKELQLAIETYKAQYGRYPAAGCGVGTSTFAGPGPRSISGLAQCNLSSNNGPYILGLVPEYIDRLPVDSRFENEANRGFYYRSDGASYKLMIRDVVEELAITAYTDEFAACPKAGGTGQCSGSVPTTTYAVYSFGAEQW